MKTKLVLWGFDADDARVLLALQLRAEDNMVDVYAFHGETANGEVHRSLFYEWREGKEMAFPESGYKHYERPLTAAEGLLPEELKVEKGDLINRAQTEWHFAVLSSKLNEAYREELIDLTTKVEGLTDFNQAVWEELKSFWDKVQEQVKERNLGRDHADKLRDKTNECFGKLKELRVKLDAAFKEKASAEHDKFAGIMDGFDARFRDGANLALLFDELKDIQKQFRNAKLTRDLRSKMWDRIDGTFKKLKEKRFGAGASSHSPLQRLDRRYKGLLEAIKRMENSIRKDDDELSFQQRKIGSTGTGQLEMQLREAKIKMINERIRSKKEKLADMNVTKKQLEEQKEKEAAKEVAREAAAKKKEEAQAKKAAAAKAKAKAAAEAKILAEAKAAEEATKEEPTDETATEKPAEEAKTADEVKPTEEATTEKPAKEVKEEPAEEPKVEETKDAVVAAEDPAPAVEEVIDEATKTEAETPADEAEFKESLTEEPMAENVAETEETPEVADESETKDVG